MREPVLDLDDQILAARARALATPGLRSAAPDQRELVVASVGDTHLAVDVRRVRQVLPPAPIARLPGGDHVVVGVRSVGGELIAVADIGPVVGLAHAAPVDERWVVVVDDPGDVVGVWVDRVHELTSDAVTYGAGLLSERPAGAAGVVAGTTGAGHLLIDVDALLAHPALRAGAARHEPVKEKETT